MKRLQFGLIALAVIAGLAYAATQAMRPAVKPADCETVAHQDHVTSTASSTSLDGSSPAPTATSAAGCAIPTQ